MTSDDFVYHYPAAFLWALWLTPVGIALLVLAYARGHAKSNPDSTWTSGLNNTLTTLVLGAFAVMAVLGFGGLRFQDAKDERNTDRVADSYGLTLSTAEAAKISGAARDVQDDDLAGKVWARDGKTRKRLVTVVENNQVVFKELSGTRTYRAN
jgi:hypothetical protein